MPSLFKFSTLNGVTHGMTQKGGGSVYGNFNLATHTGDVLEQVTKNREQLASQLSVLPQQLIFADQTHSSNVTLVTNLQENPISNTDALITNQKGICLNILTADCVPILLYDRVQKAIGVVHAGWRGTAQKIVVKTIQEMKNSFGTVPKELAVAIGPCISQEVYEVGKEVATYFSDDCLMHQAHGKAKLDLVKANINQLLDLGVHKHSIEVANTCTYKDPKFYSARRHGIKSGRFSSFLML